MTTIAIVPDSPQDSPTRFRAIAGEAQSSGATVGQALDALLAQFGGPEQTTLVIVHPNERGRIGEEEGTAEDFPLLGPKR